MAAADCPDARSASQCEAGGVALAQRVITLPKSVITMPKRVITIPTRL